MPIKIPDHLPALDVLNQENIFVMQESRAYHQDIRQLKLAIYTVEPWEEGTILQLLRLLSNSPLQVELVFLHSAEVEPKPGGKSQWAGIHKTLGEVANEYVDGLIINGTGDDEGDLKTHQSWKELTSIMKWSVNNAYSSLYIGWGAQAGLHYHYGLERQPLGEALRGVYPHTVSKKNEKLLRGFDDLFYAPHHRSTEIGKAAVEQAGCLEVIAESPDAGAYILQDVEQRRIFITGRPELEDISPGSAGGSWKGHAYLLFANWLNYCVYQETPYDLGELMYYI